MADDDMMMITRTSLWSGETRTMALPITQAQMEQWQRGTPIQVAMPHLTVSEREFVVSGMTNEEWQEMGDMESENEGWQEMGDMESEIADLHTRMHEIQETSDHQRDQGHEHGMELS